MKPYCISTFQRVTVNRVLTKTNWNQIHHVFLYIRRPMVCVSLKSGHRASRRRWIQEHFRRGRDDWCNAFFTDVSFFSVQPHSWPITIWINVALRIILHKCTKMSYFVETEWWSGTLRLSMAALKSTLSGMEHWRLNHIGMRSSNLLWFLTLQQSEWIRSYGR